MKLLDCLALRVAAEPHRMADPQESQKDEFTRLPPKSAEELSDWPRTIVHCLTVGGDPGAERRDSRLVGMVQQGVQLSSDYSGMSGEHEIFRHLMSAIKSELLPDDPFPYTVETLRVCDIGKVQQRILGWMSMNLEGGGRMCVMKDINDRLPQHARAWLDAAMPSANSSKPAAASAYAQIAAWLMENKSALFTSSSMAPCCTHNRLCPVYPMWHHSDRIQLKPESPFAQVDVRESMPSKRPRLGAVFMGSPILRPLRITLAGTTCKGWASAGKQLRFADPSERPHSIFTAERAALAEAMQEDIFFSECTSAYPASQKLSGPLSATHHIISLEIRADALGWPVRRTRCFTAGLNKRLVAWAGPTDVAAEFGAMLCCPPTLTGDTI